MRVASAPHGALVPEPSESAITCQEMDVSRIVNLAVRSSELFGWAGRPAIQEIAGLENHASLTCLRISVGDDNVISLLRHFSTRCATKNEAAEPACILPSDDFLGGSAQGRQQPLVSEMTLSACSAPHTDLLEAVPAVLPKQTTPAMWLPKNKPYACSTLPSVPNHSCATITFRASASEISRTLAFLKSLASASFQLSSGSGCFAIRSRITRWNALPLAG